jgi:hypothetical protein
LPRRVQGWTQPQLLGVVARAGIGRACDREAGEGARVDLRHVDRGVASVEQDGERLAVAGIRRVGIEAHAHGHAEELERIPRVRGLDVAIEDQGRVRLGVERKVGEHRRTVREGPSEVVGAEGSHVGAGGDGHSHGSSRRTPHRDRELAPHRTELPDVDVAPHRHELRPLDRAVGGVAVEVRDTDVPVVVEVREGRHRDVSAFELLVGADAMGQPGDSVGPQRVDRASQDQERDLHALAERLGDRLGRRSRERRRRWNGEARGLRGPGADDDVDVADDAGIDHRVGPAPRAGRHVGRAGDDLRRPSGFRVEVVPAREDAVIRQRTRRERRHERELEQACA